MTRTQNWVDDMDPRRHLKLWLLILLPLIVIASTFLLFWTERLPVIARKRPKPVHPPPDIRLPPLYETYHASELGLPQHKWHDRRPGEHEKFFSIAGYARGQLFSRWKTCRPDKVSRRRVERCIAGSFAECISGISV